MGPKRKRRGGSTCANPLFVKWVEELRDDAKRRDQSCHFTYTKALNSIKKYPLPLKSGEEAKILDYVGNKLAKILDKRLAEYNPDSDTGSSSDSGGPIYAAASTMVRGRRTNRSPPSPSSSSASTKAPPPKRRRSGRDDSSITPPPTKKYTTKEYVPAYRSGGYAIIVALYNAKEKPSWKGYLLKNEVISEAQPFSDSSFTIPQESGKYYTAWNSMGNVIRKGLVIKYSSPAKYHLTPLGEDMARRLLESSGVATPSSATAPSSRTISPWSGSTSATSRGKGSARGRNTKKGTRKQTAIDHTPLGHTSRDETPVTISSSSPECIPMASPVPEKSYVATPPVSIPSDLSDTDNSRSSSRCGRGWSIGDMDRAPSPSPPLSLSRGQSSHGLSGGRIDRKGQTDHTPSPPLFSGSYEVSNMEGGVMNQDSDSELPETISGGVDWHSDYQATPLSPSPSPLVGTRSLRFWYIDHEGKSVLEKDSAAVNFNEIVTVGFLIKCKRNDLESSTVIYTLDETNQALQIVVSSSFPWKDMKGLLLRPPSFTPWKGKDGYVYAYLSNNDAPDRALPPHKEPERRGQVLPDRALPPEEAPQGRGQGWFPVASPTSVLSKFSGENMDIFNDSNVCATTPLAETSTDLITLSDSDDDLPPPLSERLHKEVPIAAPVGRLACDSRDPKKEDSSEGRGRLALTPSQAAGRAALMRLERAGATGSLSEAASNSSKSSKLSKASSNTPVSSHCSEFSDPTTVLGPPTSSRPSKFSGPPTSPPSRFSGPPASSRPSKFSGPPASPPSRFSGPPSSSRPSKFSGPPTSPPSRFSGPPASSRPSKFSNPPTSQPLAQASHPSKSTGSRSGPLNSVSPSQAPFASASANSLPGPSASPANSHLHKMTSSPLGPLRGSAGVTQGSSSVTLRRAAPTSHVDLSEPEFVFTPGSFDVVLVVDSSESTASRMSTSHFNGILLQELGKNGVLYDVRKLNVGDFTWVARKKTTPTPGSLALPKSREVVLDYIVERKRMDDLAGSIIDGRFNEQKFRLKSCGVAHPIYLVEEYGDSTHCKLDLKALNQAVANTQVIDKFFVKRTKDIRESVAYLTIFTRYLQSTYACKTVKAYSWETIADLTKERRGHCCHDNLDSSVVHGIEFSKFNEASIKNKPLTVYEMFGRHLMQLPGLSADKAAAILEQYPTIQNLMKEVYSSSSSVAEKVKVIQDLRCGRTKRRLGPSLSKLLHSMYSLPS